MYKRIYDSEEIVVDYYNDGKPMIRVSQFKDYHWQDEHFVELPEEVEPVIHAHWVKLTPDQKHFFTDYTHCCSNCGGYGRKNYKCCPQCEAKMDEKVFEPTPLSRLPLSTRVRKRLKQMEVTTVEQLEAMDKQTLHNIPGLGRKSILEVESELRIWNTEKEKNNELLER